MRMRRMLAAAAAGFGSAALLVLPFAGRAPADTSPQTLPIYALNGVGNGIEVQLAPKPEVLDPLVDIALMRAATTANAAGGGNSSGLAADIYPGTVVIGGAGCQYQPYLARFGIQQSAYPNSGCKTITDSGETAPMQFPPGGGPVFLDAGHVKTQSGPAHSHSSAVLNHFSLAPSAALTITVDHMNVTSDSLANATTATETVTVSTSGLHITTPALSLDISNMVSRAVSITDGNAGTTDTAFTIGDVVATISGVQHRVTIDNTGIHLADLNGPTPAPGVSLPGDIRQPLAQQLEEALAQSDLIIRTGTPNEITNGANAESSIGGLLISFESGRPPAIPLSVPVQQPVPWPALPSPIGSPQGWPVPQTQPICQFPPPIPNVGLCVGQGIVPIPPGDVLASISIGGADATAAAAGTLPPTCSTCGPTVGGFFGGGTTGSAVTGGTTGGFTTGGTTGSGTGTIGNTGRLFGLVARLPSGALAGAGAAFLVLAIGLAAGPSLRS